MRKKNVDCSVYLVTDGGNGNNFLSIIEQAITGGATMVQLREKDLATGDFYYLAVQVKKITEANGIPLIINDRLDIALAVDADGLHVGREDLPVAVARRLLGPDKILGATAATVADALAAEADGADYIGSGAVYATITKPGKPVLPLLVLKQIKQAVRVPVVAIGGITPDNAVPVLQVGVDGMAVVSAIMATDNPLAAAKRFKEIWQEHGKLVV